MFWIHSGNINSSYIFVWELDCDSKLIDMTLFFPLSTKCQGLKQLISFVERGVYASKGQVYF